MDPEEVPSVHFLFIFVTFTLTGHPSWWNVENVHFYTLFSDFTKKQRCVCHQQGSTGGAGSTGLAGFPGPSVSSSSKCELLQKQKTHQMFLLRVLKVSQASKVRQENRVPKERQEHLDLRVWVGKQVVRYKFSSRSLFVPVQRSYQSEYKGHVISGFQGPAGVTGLKGGRGSQGQAVSPQD